MPKEHDAERDEQSGRHPYGDEEHAARGRLFGFGFGSFGLLPDAVGNLPEDRFDQIALGETAGRSWSRSMTFRKVSTRFRQEAHCARCFSKSAASSAASSSRT